MSIQDLLFSSPYDIKILEQLERHVSYQAESGEYDFDANRHLLKLYTLEPDSIKSDVLQKVLVMALMRLPHNDFTACICLLKEDMHDDEHIRGIMKIAGLLETAQFAKFWKEAADARIRVVLDKVPGFDDAIRTFVCTVLESTYQNISVSLVRDLLNASQNEIDSLAEARSWTKDGQRFTLPAGSDNRFPEVSTTEKIPYDDICKMLQYAKASLA